MMHRIAYAIAGAVLGGAIVVVAEVSIFAINAFGAFAAVAAVAATAGAVIGWFKA